MSTPFYLLGVSVLLVAGIVTIRLPVRRDYRDLGRLSPLSTILHASIFFMIGVFIWFDIVSVTFNQDGFWPHGMTGIAAALHPEHRGAPTESAVRVKSVGEPSGRHYWGPIVSEMVDDPALPIHTIYFEFANEDKFRRDFRERFGG